MARPRKEDDPSNLSDEQWSLVAPVLRRAVGRRGKVLRRAMLDAIFYVQRTGCQGRFLPGSSPNWKTVYSCFWRWQRSGVWDVGLATLRVPVRQAPGRKPSPPAASVDSQSVKSTEKGGRAATTGPNGCAGASA